MLTFVTWKSGVKTETPHRIQDMAKAQILFQHLLSQNSKVQLSLNGNIIKEEVNAAYPNNSKGKVISQNG